MPRAASQALNVNAEGDGRGARRTLSTPSSDRRLALAWPAILGIVLGGLVVAGLAAAVFARRRTRRAYDVSWRCVSSPPGPVHALPFRLS